jgi:hypothetical protein
MTLIAALRIADGVILAPTVSRHVDGAADVSLDRTARSRRGSTSRRPIES